MGSHRASELTATDPSRAARSLIGPRTPLTVATVSERRLLGVVLRPVGRTYGQLRERPAWTIVRARLPPPGTAVSPAPARWCLAGPGGHAIGLVAAVAQGRRLDHQTIFKRPPPAMAVCRGPTRARMPCVPTHPVLSRSSTDSTNCTRNEQVRGSIPRSGSENPLWLSGNRLVPVPSMRPIRALSEII